MGVLKENRMSLAN